ncbi:hypothetical protein RRG08_060158 [Elysia crispata]|uniref:Uncharacterized protein n=1 Tax=Elysia crispata TaxID=231223 RepID=A0AAE1DPE3_9GAST|nr:hypothetical protein RRG08_060158 [Elysia crispata]
MTVLCPHKDNTTLAPSGYGVYRCMNSQDLDYSHKMFYLVVLHSGPRLRQAGRFTAESGGDCIGTVFSGQEEENKLRSYSPGVKAINLVCTGSTAAVRGRARNPESLPIEHNTGGLAELSVLGWKLIIRNKSRDTEYLPSQESH